MTSERDDQSLAEAILRRGDERAFRTLFHRYSPMLSSFLHRVLGERAHDIDDLLQETWIRAIQSLDRFRWESSFRSWLLGIGLNVARQELRRQRPLEQYVDSVARAAHSAEERVDLERAIAQLPDGFRTVLVMYDIYGFTHDQIAELLGIASGTSKSQLSRARRSVRAMMGGNYRGMTHECT